MEWPSEADASCSTTLRQSCERRIILARKRKLRVLYLYFEIFSLRGLSQWRCRGIETSGVGVDNAGLALELGSATKFSIHGLRQSARSETR